MNRLDTKRRLLDLCRRELELRLGRLHKAMDDAQADANEHKGAMESRYDTFKEEAQALRNGYARQIAALSDEAMLLSRVPITSSEAVHLGAIVETQESDGRSNTDMIYFIAPGLMGETIETDGQRFLFLRPDAPIAQALLGRKAGERTRFGGRAISIVAVH